MRTTSAIAAIAALSASSTLAGGTNLLTFDSTADIGILLDPFDGSVVNSNYLDIQAAADAVGYTGSLTPLEGISVGSEVWVSDQLADRIWRFDAATGNFVGDITGNPAGPDGLLNNIRGIEVVGNTVYAALGSDSSAFDRGIARIDATTGQVIDSFNGRALADTSYFDVFDYNGQLYVPNIDTGNDGIEIYDYDGTFQGVWVSSDGTTSFDFLEQLAEDANGDLLAAGFSPPSGVYSISADGTVNGIVAALDAGPRGVAQLGNGEILWTNGSFIATDSTTILTGGSYRFLSEIVVPAPASGALIALAGFAAPRRRR